MCFASAPSWACDHCESYFVASFLSLLGQEEGLEKHVDKSPRFSEAGQLVYIFFIKSVAQNSFSVLASEFLPFFFWALAPKSGKSLSISAHSILAHG